MSRYLDRSLQEGEKVIQTTSIHWVIYHQGLFFTFLGMLLGHLGAGQLSNILGVEFAEIGAEPLKYASLGIVAFGGLLLIGSFIRQISTELIITNRRVIAKYGFISTTTFELMMSKVEGANIDQTILGRILGYGTVMVKGTGGGISPIDHVAKPYAFHNCLMECVRASQSNANYDDHD